MGRKKKDFGKELPNGEVECAGCGASVKRSSIYAHLKTDEHKYRAQMLEMRREGWVRLDASSVAVELLPKDSPICPLKRACSYYNRGGWGHGATVRNDWYAPKDVTAIIEATVAVEPPGYSPSKYAQDRIKGFFAAIFATEESFGIARVMLESFAESDSQRMSPSAAREWANRIALHFDVTKLLTETERMHEDARWRTEEQARVRREQHEQHRAQEEQRERDRKERERNERHLAAVPLLAEALRAALAALPEWSIVTPLAREALEQVKDA